MAQQSDESHAACIQNTRYSVTTVPGNSSLARGAIPTADMLSDDGSVAKCDTRLTFNAGVHANPPLSIVFPSLFLREFHVAFKVPDLFSFLESGFPLTLVYSN